MKQISKKRKEQITFWLFLLCLCLYAFRKVDQGIDTTDTGYHFSNFLYMSEMDPMWIFSTYLASVLGHFFTCLPGGTTLLGINIYTAILPAVLGAVTFVFFVRVIKADQMNTFLGVLISLALCWCPTTCVYNYLTFLFFTAGAMLLYLGLVKEKQSYLVAAGVCLGMNVLVRFPNAAEAALILVVWYVCFLRRNTFVQYVQKTAWCLLGYVLGIAVVFVWIGVQYGIGAYVEGIIRLLSMTSDASDYTLYSMIYSLVQAYLFSGKWVLILAVCVGLGVLGFSVFRGKLVKLKGCGYVVCCMVLIRWFYGQGMFNLEYGGYGAIFNWGAVFLIFALLFAAVLVFSKKASEQDKILAGIVVIVIGITPLGSNNQIYANLNNMFFVLPFVLYVFQKMFRTIVQQKKERWYAPLIMGLVCIGVLTWQSLQFGTHFVFRDEEPRTSQVEQIEALAGMKTNENRARSLEELGAYVQEQGLTGERVLLFGDVPGLSAYLRMPFVMSPWPELASYSNDTFQAELEKIEQNIEQSRPVIMMGAKFYEFLLDRLEGEEKNTYEQKYGFKTSLLRDMIEENEYAVTFINEEYVVLE